MKLNSSEYRSLIMAAAKKVCDDPEIDFDTPDGAKKALVLEIDRTLREVSKADNPEETLHQYIRNILSERNVELNQVIPEDLLDNLDSFKISAGGPIIQSVESDNLFPGPFDTFDDTEKFFDLMKDGCRELGYKPKKGKEYSLKGKDAKKLLRFVADHWNDKPVESNGSMKVTFF